MAEYDDTLLRLSSPTEPQWRLKEIKIAKLITNRASYKCYHCDLEPPVRNESDPRCHKCIFCKQSYPNHAKFKIHFKEAHGRNEGCFCYQIPSEKFVINTKLPLNKIASEAVDTGVYKQKVFTSNGVLKAMNNDPNHNQPKCYQCEMEPPITNQSDPRRHKCLFCKRWFPNHIEFKIHFKNAHNSDADSFFSNLSNCNEFTCYICERDFFTRYYLIAHMKSHHDKFLCHQCPTCGKRYRAYGILTQHLKTHEGKTYKCDQCDKEFPYYARLRIHLWSHKTELNYVCDLCSKGFKMRKYLKRHMTMHSDVKQYACRYCESRFTFTTGRRAHEKSQHNVL